jgi:hypothetical protein
MVTPFTTGLLHLITDSDRILLLFLYCYVVLSDLSG